MPMLATAAGEQWTACGSARQARHMSRPGHKKLVLGLGGHGKAWPGPMTIQSLT